MSRSSSPRAVLPPTDHVARELLKRGARGPALELLRAAIRRDPGERACAALIKALEARPDAAVSGPELALDLPLIDDYVARGMLVEARAVLSGAGLDVAGAGADRARALDELLAPTPPDAEPALVEAFRHLTTGGASLSLSLIEEHAQKGHALPPWAAGRREVLRRLLLDRVLDGDARAAPPSAAPSAPTELPPAAAHDVAAVVGRLIHERDLRGAAARLRAHAASAPLDAGAAVGASALSRLVHALDLRDGSPGEVADMRTVPMGPQKVADLNLRMGNLAEAERLYRRVLLDEPENAELRTMLDDVQAVRHFVDSPAAIAPTPHAGLTRARTEAVAAELAVRPTEPLPMVDDLGEPELPRLYTDIVGESSAEAFSEPPVLPSEVTRRVSSTDLAAIVATTRTPSESPPAGLPSSPVLSKKGAGPSGGFGVATGYGPAKAAPGRSWADDDATGILEPAVEAELLLQQGFADRALATYRMLLAARPSSEKYQRRVAEIEALIAAPLPDDPTVRRDVSELQRMARPTGVRLTVPDEVRAAAGAASAAAPAGTLDAPGIPQGDFEDATTRVTFVRSGPSVTTQTGSDTVRITRIVVVR